MRRAATRERADRRRPAPRWQATPAGVGDNGGMSDEQPHGAGPANVDPPGAATSTGRVTVRRAPRYPRFIILGAGLGAIVAFVSTAILPVDPAVGFGALFGYFALFGVSLGAALGGLIAIVLDSVASRSASELAAERTVVDATPEEVEGTLED